MPFYATTRRVLAVAMLLAPAGLTFIVGSARAEIPPRPVEMVELPPEAVEPAARDGGTHAADTGARADAASDQADAGTPDTVCDCRIGHGPQAGLSAVSWLTLGGLGFLLARRGRHG